MPPYAYYELDRIYSEQQWQKKQSWITNYLANFQPDIIGFQEVFSIESLKALVKKQGYKYFATIDQPEVIDDHIYQSPVVAIAAKFPIITTQGVSTDTALATTLGLNANFAFARKVLRATIAIPDLGPTDCYVVHFKSKRSTIDDESQSPKQEQALTNRLKAQLAGKWAASIQRGSEAALLMCEIISRREVTSQPIILMGDFNDSLSDGVLAHLSTKELTLEKGKSEAQLLAKYLLQDAWQLFESANKNELATDSEPIQANTSQRNTRVATHYYGSKGKVLDYILLSHEFDASQHDSFFMVSQYDVYDKHLISPDFAIDGESSDHAPVLVTLTLRS